MASNFPELPTTEHLQCVGENRTTAIIFPVGGGRYSVSVVNFEGATEHTTDCGRAITGEAVPAALTAVGFQPVGEWTRHPLPDVFAYRALQPDYTDDSQSEE